MNLNHDQITLWKEKDQCVRLQKRFGDYDEYKNNCGNSETKVPIFKVMNEILDEGIKNGTPYSLLDVGCGPGHFLWSFKEKVSKLIGLDHSEHMLELAKNQLSKFDIATEFIEGSTWSIPLPDNYSDIALQVDVCMHVGGAFDSIKEMIRVSKKYVIFTGPSFEMFSNTMDKKIAKKSWAVSIPILEFELKNLVLKKTIKSWRWEERPNTVVYHHRILVIEII